MQLLVVVLFKPKRDRFCLGCSERKLESRRKAAEEARRNAEEEQRREETLLQQVNDRAAQRQQLAEAGQPQLIRAEVC